MRIVLILFILATASVTSFAQNMEDEQAIAALITQLFDGMRASDTASMSPLFLPGARLQSVFYDQEGKTVIRQGTMQGWLDGVGSPHEKVLDERIWTIDVLVDGPLANAWTDYSFYIGEDLHHCGVNAFQLVKRDGKWKVYQVTDTRRQDGCITERTQPEQEIHAFLDDWHQAAATADAEGFFGAMAEDAIYLGTDASERWLRDELREWAKEAFQGEVAWAFTPSERRLYFTSDKKTAWFEEKLDTWMGTCRGSGVVQQLDGAWKLKHYNLAVLIPNEKIEDFRKLVGASR
jgi:hypothetical protein